jgi:hypothetical protein
MLHYVPLRAINDTSSGGKVMLMLCNILFFTFNLAVLTLAIRKVLKVKRKYAILKRRNNLTWR